MAKRLLQITLGCVLLGVIPTVAAPVSNYTVESKIHVAGDQGWDLLTVDESTGRLFVSHGDRVDVVDTRSGKSVGTIMGINGAHGVAIATEAGKGFATSGKDTSVVIFDLKSLAVQSRLHTQGTKPDAIVYDSASKRVFVGLAGSNKLEAIDAASAKSLGSIALEGNPELMDMDGKGMLYVAIEDKSQVVAINARTLKIKATWSLAPGEEPSGLALDPATHRLFAACHNHMMVVMDAESGKVITNVPISDRIDGAVFDQGLKRAYASGGDGILSVIQEGPQDHFTVLESVTTKLGARTIALDSKTHQLYLPTADFGPAPAATPEHPKPRPAILPGTFTIVTVTPTNSK